MEEKGHRLGPTKLLTLERGKTRFGVPRNISECFRSEKADPTYSLEKRGPWFNELFGIFVRV